LKSKEQFEAHIAEYLRRFREELGDQVVFSFPVNLKREGNLCEGMVIFGEKHFSCVFTREDEWHNYDYTRLTDAKHGFFIGGSVCEIYYDGEWQEFCRAFSSERENVSQLVRILKEVADGVLEPKNAEFFYRSTVCPICRRPLLHRGMTICNVCAGKKGSVSKLYDLIRPQLGWIALTVFLFLFTSFLNMLLPSIQGKLVDNYLTTDDPAAVLASFETVVLIACSMALVRVSIVLFTVLRNTILTWISSKTMVALRHTIYEKIQSLSVAGISQLTAGDLINRVSGDTNTIANFLNSQLPAVLEQLLMILMVACILFSFSWKLALMIFLPTPFVIVMFRMVWRRNYRYYSRQWVESSRANTVLHDTFQGVRVVKVYGTEKNEIEKYDHAIKALRDISYRNEKAWAKVVPLADFLMQVGSFILLFYVGNEILKENMTIGQLTTFSAFVNLVYGPLRWMANIPSILQSAMTSVARVFEVIDEEPDVADKKNAVEMKIRGQIDIDKIWFGYTENENALENVSVSIGPGEMLGIVGKSGVGKSTLINLVMRLYDVRRGAIRIDGVDIRDISQHSLRSQIGVVLQETFLFAGTIFENLAYAKPEASFEEVMEAARLANAHSFIMKLPDGYNTYVGERGYTLSGGERQRIAIARAILHDPRILILDEATSALDTETEKMVQDALQRLCKNRTTIAIAHRLSTLRNATKLLVLDRKTVAEVGTHDELMQKEGGIYQGLVLAQREMSTIKKKKEQISSEKTAQES